MTRLPDVPAYPRLLPDARLYEVWAGPSDNLTDIQLVASFSALESAVEHIGWRLRQEPMQHITLDILPPVEVQAPCAICDEVLMVPLETARRILSGAAWVEHDRKNHRVLSLEPANQEATK